VETAVRVSIFSLFLFGCVRQFKPAAFSFRMLKSSRRIACSSSRAASIGFQNAAAAAAAAAVGTAVTAEALSTATEAQQNN